MLLVVVAVRLADYNIQGADSLEPGWALQGCPRSPQTGALNHLVVPPVF